MLTPNVVEAPGDGPDEKCSPAAFHLPYEEWVNLNPGQRVWVLRQGEGLTQGTVDDVAEDASFFWIWLDEGKGRVLIYHGDGSFLWNCPCIVR